MPNKFILYKDGYKYQLAEDYLIKTEIIPKKLIDEDYIRLDKQGTLTVKKGYAWDGTSGPVRDTDKNMRGSLVHDALYQLMRMEKLDRKTEREPADKLFRKICLKDGVPKSSATRWYNGLRLFGARAAKGSSAKKLLRSPKAK